MKKHVYAVKTTCLLILFFAVSISVPMAEAQVLTRNQQYNMKKALVEQNVLAQKRVAEESRRIHAELIKVLQANARERYEKQQATKDRYQKKQIARLYAEKEKKYKSIANEAIDKAKDDIWADAADNKEQIQKSYYTGQK